MYMYRRTFKNKTILRVRIYYTLEDSIMRVLLGEAYIIKETSVDVLYIHVFPLRLGVHERSFCLLVE